jgi:hypothetical protein
MRRVPLALGIAVLICVMAAGSAQAGPLRVRSDPNDSTSNLDIRKVITRLSATTMYLRLSSWDRFRTLDMQETWQFALDTIGGHRFDRWVNIYPTARGIKCDVGKGPHGFTEVGRRPGTRPDRRSAACHLPRGWFGHIHRAVRFKAFVAYYSSPSAADDAPDHGLYRWI